MYPFIALEGCDGAGKTTMRRLITQSLERFGLPVFAVGQHSWLHLESSRVLAEVRSGVAGLSPVRIAEAYRMDKKEHYTKNIAPALTQALVISDRWILSDAVYQEVLYGIRSEETLAAYERDQVPWPCLIVYVYCEVSEAYKRILARGKAARHYERPSELSEVCNVYDRVLSCPEFPVRTGVVRVPNHGDLEDLNAVLHDHLLPTILSSLRCTGYESQRVSDPWTLRRPR